MLNKRITLPKGQKWFLSIMDILGYDFDAEGVCFGISYMAMQAILAEELDVFDDRLVRLFNIKLEELEKYKKKSGTEAPQLGPLSDIFAFLDGVNIYQEVYKLSELFEKDKAPLTQNALSSIPLTLSKKLEKQGGVDQITKFSGMYNKNELENYFLNFSKIIENTTITRPITFILNSQGHAITLGYHPTKKIWSFTNANQLPSKYFTSNSDIAKNVISAFSKNEITTFTTEIYAIHTNKEDTLALDQYIKDWKKQPSMVAMHTVSSHKANLADSDNRTWLYVAAKHGEFELVKDLVRHGANVNIATIKKGFTPLHISIIHGHLDMARFLLKNGADVNTACNDGFTPLYLSIAYGNLDMVRFLLENGADVNAANNMDITPLYYAAENGHLEVVKLLLENGANGVAQLHYAIQNKSIQTINTLLTSGIDINAYDDEGRTPLYTAINSGFLSITKHLLTMGANPNLINDNGDTPLHCAAGQNKPKTLLLLLKNGANIDAPNSNGFTPLFFASEKGHYKVVKLLLEKGADVNMCDDECKLGALHIATQENHSDVVKLLIENHANINAISIGGTPLQIAVELNREGIAKILLENGADVNLASPEDGATPLHVAVKNNNLSIVIALLDKGANQDAIDNQGLTPLDIAKESNHIDIIKFFSKQILINYIKVTNVTQSFFNQNNAAKALLNVMEGKSKDLSSSEYKEIINNKELKSIYENIASKH